MLAARQLVGAAAADIRQLDQFEHGLDRLLDLAARQAAHLQAETDVLGHAHVREQGVALEHRVDRAAERRQVLHGFAVQADGAAAGLLEAGNQPQQGGLAAAGGAQQGEELVGADLQRHLVEGAQGLSGLAELHAQVFDADRAGHLD